MISLCLTPVVRDLFLKAGFVDNPDGKRKLHARPIPRVGGVAIAIAYLAALSSFYWAPLEHSFDLGKNWNSIAGIVTAGLVVFAIGLVDDLIGLRAWQKFLGQAIAACIAYFSGVQFNLGNFNVDFLSLPLTVIWLIACSNALNLIDGLDGLAAGSAMFSTATILVGGLLTNNLELALVTVPLLGALLGFLRYNFNPASVFLGDSGSLPMGFILGCYGILWSQKSATVLGITAPMFAMAVPMIDVGLSIVRRFLSGKPIFGADRGHIHHKLLDLGLTPRRAALAMYAVSAIFAVLTLLMHSFQNQFGGLIIVLFCVCAWVGVQHLGYVEFAKARQILFAGGFRQIIDIQSRLSRLERELSEAQTLDAYWQILSDRCADFGFVGLRLSLEEATLNHGNVDADPGVWQMRISLGARQYLNFYRPPVDEMRTTELSGFVTVVTKTLQEKREAIAAAAAAARSEGLAPVLTMHPVPVPVRARHAAGGR